MRISEPPAPESPSASEAAPGFVRFTINWGERAGAAPNRLLGHVCRRGQVRGHLVGAIEIGPDESSFDVDASVAARFEKLVRRPDRRDPRLRILRATAKRAPRGHGEQDRPRAKPRPKRRFGA
jgi:ATP-dependent RNA helicase DeaD